MGLCFLRGAAGRWCPEEEAGFFERYSWSFCNSLVKMGASRPLEPEDVWDLHPRDTVRPPPAKLVNLESSHEPGSASMLTSVAFNRRSLVRLGLV